MYPLISVAELVSQLNDPDLVIVDCRHELADPASGSSAYSTGHIPGAIHLHLDNDLSGPKTGSNGRHPLPNPQTLAQTLGAVGIHRGSHVVAYDSGGVSVAARLWWMLEWLGHDRVQVLDGAYPAWQAAGMPIATEVTQYPPANFEVDLQPDHLVRVDQVQANLATQEFLLVDARSAERFRGIGETLDPVGGHIPQAANRFYQNNLDAVGRFKAPEVLQAEWQAIIGQRSAQQTMHQCGSGVTACQNLLALAAAGMKGGRLYAGSWSEWCADPARPVARD